MTTPDLADIQQSNKLRKHAWYRLLQVIYFLALAFAFFVSTGLIFELYGPDESLDHYHVVCSSGFEFDRDIVYLESDIRRTCAGINTPFSDYENVGRAAKSLYPGQYDDFSDKSLGQFIVKKYSPTGDLTMVKIPARDPDNKNYFETPVFKEIGSWKKFVGYAILSILLITFIFEVIRRIFFYITLQQNPFALPKWMLGSNKNGK